MISEQQTRTRQRYAAVRHLDTQAAAAALGLTFNTVQNYRRCNPEARPDAPPAAPEPPPKPQRDDVRVAYAMGNLPCCSSADLHMTPVSVVKEPWL